MRDRGAPTTPFLQIQPHVWLQNLAEDITRYLKHQQKSTAVYPHASGTGVQQQCLHFLLTKKNAVQC